MSQCGHVFGKPSTEKRRPVTCKALPKGQRYCPAQCPSRNSDICALLEGALEIVAAHR